MSGFEVVGVVLGTLPLAISALEHYRDGLRVIQRWRRYERELQSLIRNLETERAKLQNVCEMLLTGLVSHSRIEAMVDDPLGSLWLEEGILKKVRVRLWRSWDVFEKNLQDMNIAIGRLVDALGNPTRASNPKASGMSIVWELKRATFALDRSAYLDLLTTIRDGVSNLESLISSNITLEPERRVRSRLRLLSIIRHVSLGLYRATRSSFTQCTCRHDVGLRLSTYSAYITPGDDDETVTQRLELYAALSHEIEASGRSRPVTKKQLWDEVTVQVVPLPSQLPSPLPPPTPEESPGSPSRNRRLRSVRFSSFQSQPWFRSSTSSTENSMLSTTQMSSTPTLSSASTYVSEEVADLCQILKTSKTLMGRGYPTECYGRVFDKLSSTQRCFAVYPQSPPTGRDNSKMVSLRDVLSPKSEIQPLSYRDRLQLAVFVASSVLQLYSTPWLPEILTSTNVFFLIREGFPDSEHAFVIASSGHPSPGQQPQATATGSNTTALPVKIRNPMLFALGILLIEIICGQTIDAMRTPEDSQGVFTINTTTANSNTVLSDYMVARRLLSQVYEASSNYGSAVRRCINGDFPRQKLDLDDEDFRQEVYSGVVSLLEEDLGHT